jgi:type VI secretion system protein ImpL
MEGMKGYIVTGAGVLVALAGSWAIGYVASDKGWDRTILRVALALIVLIAGALIVWFLSRRNKPEKAAPQQEMDVRDELEFVLRAAEAKLASAGLKQGDRLGSYPVYFLLGPTASAKTTVVIQSGLEPELLGGQVYAEGNVAPTVSANLWYSRESIFVEPGANPRRDPAIWSRLLRRFEPGKLKSVVKKGAQPPRAVVACYDVENLLRQPLETNLSEARAMRTRLSEICLAFGISVPVYVLFTKLDRTAFFHEYIAGFTETETAQVLGAAVPLKVPSGGVYSEEQSSRLNQCFEQLFYSLCSRRPELLAREADPGKTPAVYEFPREFRKLRTPVVSFLVELCRPSQLAIGPILRGFYFTGVRPVIVREVMAAPVPGMASAPAAQAGSNATRIFRAQDFGAAQARVEAPTSETTDRRVPQWVFLKSFFQDVLLADSSAMGVTGRSTRTDTLRRVLLASAALLFLGLSIAFIVSFAGNRNLGLTALRAASGITPSATTGADLPSLDELNRLESLRQSLVVLTEYEREGSPVHLSWGLYTGNRIYPTVRTLYFDRFRQLLLQPIQRQWESELKRLPSASGPNDNADRAYNSLKAYLITTSNHEKSTREFLSPLLAARWAEGRNSGNRLALATRQFDFYSDELKLENPFPADNDAAAVGRARQYLASFGDFERVYRYMLAEANTSNKKVNFNETFKGSEEEVVNNRDVAGAFTKDGWTAMQNSLKNIAHYLKGEEWVLGNGLGTAKTDQEKLVSELNTRYTSDFVAQWQGYLRNSAVRKYDDVNDAVKKLSVIASAQSPLLQMFCLASQNTAVDSPDVQSPFKALHSILPPQSTCDLLVVPNNSDYMSALLKLKSSIEQASTAPSTDSANNQTASIKSDALLLVDQKALTFGGSDPNNTISTLLKAPITNIDAVLGGAAELNKKGAGLCRDLSQLTNKYPFSPKAKSEASLADLDFVFQPKQGAFWKFYDDNLTKLLAPKDSQYGPAPGAAVQLDPEFVRFFNRAAAFAGALYPGGRPDPQFAYKLKVIRIDGIDGISLDVDGQSLSYDGGATKPVLPLAWPGNGAQSFNGIITPRQKWADAKGLWAAFKFFRQADEFHPDGTLKWIIRVAVGRNTQNDSTGDIILALDMGANPPIFEESYLPGIRCVATVAVVPK